MATAIDMKTFVEGYVFNSVNEINEMVKPWLNQLKQIQSFTEDFSTMDWKFMVIWKWPHSRHQVGDMPEEEELDWAGDWHNSNTVDTSRQAMQIADAHIVSLKVDHALIDQDRSRITMTVCDYINQEFVKMQDEIVQAIASKAFP